MRAHVQVRGRNGRAENGKSELFSHFAEKFEIKRTQSRELFDDSRRCRRKSSSGRVNSTLPGMVKLVVQKAKGADGPQPRYGRSHQDSRQTVVKARIQRRSKTPAARK